MRRPVDKYTTPAMGRWGAWRASGLGHQGWDYYAPRGTPIYAIADGYVPKGGVNYSGSNAVRSSWSAQVGFGHNVQIMHGTVKAYYCHMNAIPLVAEGAQVREGQLIGYVGDSGNAWAVGTHCHLQTSRVGVNFDPESLFGGGTSAPAGAHITPFFTLAKADTEKLQRLLNEVADAGLKMDGDYGDKTIAAVKAWQKRSALIEDGKAGVNTFASLDAAIKQKRAAEAAAKLAKETANMFTLIWDTEKNRSGYLATANGIVGIGDHADLTGRQIFTLFQRLRDGQRNGTEETFNLQEIAIMRHFLESA